MRLAIGRSAPAAAFSGEQISEFICRHSLRPGHKPTVPACSRFIHCRNCIALERLVAIATADRAAFFFRYPHWAEFYAGRILCTALCQGAALHYLYGAAGIQDFDVYTFYAEHPGRPWYARRRAVYDFGDPKFGQSADRPHFVGRRVDVWGRGDSGGVG